MALQLCNVAGWFGSVAETGLGDLNRAQKAKNAGKMPAPQRPNRNDIRELLYVGSNRSSRGKRDTTRQRAVNGG